MGSQGLKGPRAAGALGGRGVEERWRAKEALRDETDTLETINRLGQTIVGELDQEILVQAVTGVATELTGAQFGGFLYNVPPSTERL